jgi:anhydro-N-acetylmuramic acid kinase
MPELFVGLMSGTSLDAIDAVLVDLASPTPRQIAVHSHPLPSVLRTQLLTLCHGGTVDELRLTAELDVRLGRLFAEAALALLQQAATPASAVRAIGSHGQTVRHEPDGDTPFSVQIGDPNVIAQLTGITTVADFRRRDIAAGGQGAPLVPAFHAAALRSADEDRVVLNIGGMANITVLPRDPQQAVTGFDTGPGNVLMDAWAARHLGTPQDDEGHWAGSAPRQEPLLAALLSDGYFQRPPPKSTGRELFNMDWLEARLAQLDIETEPAQVQASLVALTAQSCAIAIQHYAQHTQRVLVCGGGVHNVTLMQQLTDALPGMRVASTQTLGLDPDWVEALAFAWLAKQTLEGKPGNLPSVTGAKASVVLGGIYLASGK